MLSQHGCCSHAPQVERKTNQLPAGPRGAFGTTNNKKLQAELMRVQPDRRLKWLHCFVPPVNDRLAG